MAPIDFSMAAPIHQHLLQKGVSLYLEEGVTHFKRTDNGITVFLKSGKAIPADMVLLSIGVRPATALAQQAGLKLGEMGGIWVDRNSHTSMAHLFAVGETSCNGVHGANRLASNSLLESLVFAKRAAGQMAELGFLNDEIAAKKAADSIDLADYSDEKAVEREYRKLAMEAIEGLTGVGTEETVESGIAYIQA